MPARCSVFIDAGYLLASAATRVTGTSLRSGIHVEFGKLIEGIRRQAEQISGMPVLRVHWYDSARNAVPDIQQQRIGELPRVKLRLGRFGIDGQQKGVDLRLGLDLVTHARNGAAEVFLLVSGDDDFTEAVEEAQLHGVEVILLAAPDANGGAHAVSRYLQRAADELHVIDAALVDEAVLKVERPRLLEGEDGDEVLAPVDGAEIVGESGAEEPVAGTAPLAPEAPTAAAVEAVSEIAAAPEPETAAPAAPAPAATPRPGRRPAPSSAGRGPVPGPPPSRAGESARPAVPAAPPGEAPATPAPVPAPATPPAAAAPAAPVPAAPAPAAPAPSAAVNPPAPRTPKDVAATMRRAEGDGVVLPPDAVARPGTFADEFHATVVAVVGRVLNSLALTSTPRAWKALELGRPSIPREVDKALLIDVTAAMGVVELSDLERHEIREAFWKAYDALVEAARA